MPAPKPPSKEKAAIPPKRRTLSQRLARRMLMRKPLTMGRAAGIIVSFTLAMTLIGGVLIRYADKQSFPNIGDGLWWSVQTVTTVGYGDHVPTNVVGRAVAAIVMLVGIGFLSVLTATITAAFIESTRKRLEGVEMKTLDRKLDAISSRLTAIEASIGQAGAGDAGAQGGGDSS
jgi:voltage-gated potassium channel Kch